MTNGGAPEYLLASADWMPRNLDRRVEIAFPVLDPALQTQVRAILDTQLSDTAKARLLLSDGGSHTAGPRRWHRPPGAGVALRGDRLLPGQLTARQRGPSTDPSSGAERQHQVADANRLVGGDLCDGHATVGRSRHGVHRMAARRPPAGRALTS